MYLNNLCTFKTTAEYDTAKIDILYPNVSHILDEDKFIYLMSYPWKGGLKNIGWSNQDITRLYKDTGIKNPEPIEHEYTPGVFINYAKWEDTSSVTNMDGKFFSGESLISVPQFDTSSVTNMSNMFHSCTALASVPRFNTNKVANMSWMFSSCPSLTSVPQFDTSSVTDMIGMFWFCSALTSIPQFDTSSVAYIGSMFEGCSSLTSVPQFDASKVNDMGNIFKGCSELTNLGGFTNLKCSLDLSACTKLTHDSLMNVINLASTVKPDFNADPNGVYIVLGPTNRAKLSEQEQKIATDKGWNLLDETPPPYIPIE